MTLNKFLQSSSGAQRLVYFGPYALNGRFDFSHINYDFGKIDPETETDGGRT